MILCDFNRSGRTQMFNNKNSKFMKTAFTTLDYFFFKLHTLHAAFLGTVKAGFKGFRVDEMS